MMLIITKMLIVMMMMIMTSLLLLLVVVMMVAVVVLAAAAVVVLHRTGSSDGSMVFLAHCQAGSCRICFALLRRCRSPEEPLSHKTSCP